MFCQIILYRVFRKFYDRAYYNLRSTCLFACSLKILEETIFGDSALVVAVLSLVHCKLEELLVVLTAVPALVLHHRAELVEFVREGILRGSCVEFKTFVFRKLNYLRSKFSRKSTHLSEDHVPCILVDGCPARLSLESAHKVHERRILHILAERRH